MCVDCRVGQLQALHTVCAVPKFFIQTTLSCTAQMLQGGPAVALHAACATPDNAAGSGIPLLRAQLRSSARGGADEVAAEVLLPCGDSESLSLSLQKVRQC